LGEGKGFARCEVHGHGYRLSGVFHASIVRLNCETTQALISLASAFVSKPFLCATTTLHNGLFVVSPLLSKHSVN
jgi:hypothetical protein